MLNIDEFIRYQAYGKVISTLENRLDRLVKDKGTKRPATSTLLILLGESACDCREAVNESLNDICYSRDSLAEVIEHKLNYDTGKKYLDCIADCVEECIKAFRELDRPTRGKIDSTLKEIMDGVRKKAPVIQLDAFESERGE